MPVIQRRESVARTRLRKGDEVLVIVGKDRGKQGRVQEVLPKSAQVIVEGVNIAKRHTKANPQRNVKGGIVEQPVPLGLGKVMLVCPHCNAPTRIGLRNDEDGTKERFCKSCGDMIAQHEEKK